MNAHGRLVSIDPGASSSGFAVFNNGSLVEARNVSNDVIRASLVHYLDFGDGLVVEMPQTYGGRAAGRSDANVLLDIAREIGTFEAQAIRAHAKTVFMTPREWKGQVPKDIMCRRVWGRLSLVERAVCRISKMARSRLCNAAGAVPESATHPLDAAGLGMKVLGRL